MQRNSNLDEMLRNQHPKNDQQISVSISFVQLSTTSPFCHAHSLQNNVHDGKILLATLEINGPEKYNNGKI